MFKFKQTGLFYVNKIYCGFTSKGDTGSLSQPCLVSFYDNLLQKVHKLLAKFNINRTLRLMCDFLRDSRSVFS